MEQDFKDRAHRRRNDKTVADGLRLKGNEAMKRGLYKSAKHHYTEALESRKDLLAVYTNRALCAIKVEDM
jgi:hypothetical protein